jgi:transposase
VVVTSDRWNVREIVNGLMYILSTGCQWREIPKDLPPRSTLYDYFDLWSWDGTKHLQFLFGLVGDRGGVSKKSALVMDSVRLG